MDWISIVQSLGFPIACVAALGWFVVRLTDQHKAEMDAVTEALHNNTAVLIAIKERLGVRDENR
jgi:flagellar biogenesis protein FliO